MSLIAQFSTDSDPGSQEICYLTQGEYSHVDLVLPEGLLGARLSGGVAVRTLGYKSFTKIARVQVELPDEAKAIDFARSQIGKPYNTDAIIDMIFHRTRSFTSTQAKWFCDELLYAAAAEGGLLLLNTVNPLNLTPQEVFLSPFWKPETL